MKNLTLAKYLYLPLLIVIWKEEAIIASGFVNLSNKNHYKYSNDIFSSSIHPFHMKNHNNELNYKKSTLNIITNIHGGDISNSMISTLVKATNTISPKPGLIPAIFSPLSSALGFMIWDNNWHGSAFSLNLVKNIIACIFFTLFLTINNVHSIPNMIKYASQGQLPLLALSISAFLGVVVGDCTAIAALRRLGSRRYLLIDCLKPSLSVLIGTIAFGEQLTIRSILGITFIVIGVYIASIQKIYNEDNMSNQNHQKVFLGYLYALGHLIFDTVGAAITKKCMGEKTSLGPLSVGLLRFGAAAIMLKFIGIIANIFHHLFQKHDENTLYWWSFPQTISDSILDQQPANTMTENNWKAIVLGTFFVTFLGPSLYYRSLQFMTLGIGVTLSCTAPLYEPILAKLLRGTNINGKAIMGSILAFLGVSTLCL